MAGHSSGAFSVNFHLLSPGSRGLFAHGILEGTALESWQGLGQFFGGFFGCRLLKAVRLLRAKDSGWYYSTKDAAYKTRVMRVVGISCLRPRRQS